MSAAAQSDTSTPKPGESKANKVQDFSLELLKVYYGRLFPYQEMFDWLSYSNNPTSQNPGVDRGFFYRREWSFTINDDIYVRYQAFKDINEFAASIKKKNPHKIDIGAVFNKCPADQSLAKSDALKPVERELVFDIDMTDYDDIRTCCKGADICARCWPYMTMAMKVVDRTLREDFAFRHILWVYSGRRGVHCWVCDPHARSLPNEARGAIVDYMSVDNGPSDNSDKRLNFFANPHPMLRRAYEQLEPYFKRCIADESGQGLLSSDRFVGILSSLPDDVLSEELRDKWKKDKDLTGADRWEQIKETIANLRDQESRALSNKRKRIDFSQLQAWCYALVFKHCFPRLDANVSKTQNHLLKSPFCVHPKTGRVCVPIDVNAADDFDPFCVPTVRSLCEEIDRFDESSSLEAEDINKTSLKTSMELFRRVFMNDLLVTNREMIRSRADREAAMSGDF